MKRAIVLAIAAIAFAAPSVAATQTGPVATACKDDIAQYCAGKPHTGETRACLEANKDKVSPECKSALETTGHGKRMGKGKGKGKGPADGSAPQQ